MDWIYLAVDEQNFMEVAVKWVNICDEILAIDGQNFMEIALK